MAMLAFTLFACEDEEKKQAKSKAEAVAEAEAEAEQSAAEQAKKPSANSPEAIASLYIKAGAKMDMETLKKITTGKVLEKIIATEASLKLKASSKGQSYEEFMEELEAEAAKRGEPDIKSATKASDDGKSARVIVSVLAKNSNMEMEIPTPLELSKENGNWKVSDTPQQ
jgi:hypothetical protein